MHTVEEVLLNQQIWLESQYTVHIHRDHYMRADVFKLCPLSSSTADKLSWMRGSSTWKIMVQIYLKTLEAIKKMCVNKS